MNPCPCGLAGDPDRQCLCTPDRIRRYRRSVSGPLLDRIDLHVTLQRPSPEWVLSKRSGPKTRSGDLRNRVAQLQQRQRKRQGCLNRDLAGEALIEVCALKSETESWLIAAVSKLDLSARSAHRRLRVARSLADMDGDEVVTISHLETALSFREAPLEDAGIPQRLESTM